MTYLEEYAHAVLDGKIVANEKIKKEYKRLLFDFENPSLSRWHYDPILGNRPVEFIEKFCKQSKGKLGKPLKLELFQKAFLNAAFGFVDKNGIRRFQEVLLVIGRKNGKTTLLAGIELYCATADGEGAPEVYNAATSRDQANIGFTECVNMVSQSPLLKRHWHKRQSDLYFKANKGIIKALASNTNGLDGLNTHCATIDELAAIKNRDLYDLIKQSMSARSQPLLAEITTNGFVRDSIFDSQYEYATGVINGTIDDERFLPIIYELDDYDEWDKPDMWIKANPGLGTIKSEEFLRNCVEKAKNDPAFKPTVLVKDFNLKQNSSSAWLDYQTLNNEETFDLDSMGFRYGIGGIDAADSVDLSAAKLLCMKPNDPKVYVAQMYWIPQSKLDQMKTRHHKDDAPYELWRDQGYVRVVPGNKVPKRVFLDWFKEMRDEHDIYIYKIGYDPWHMDDSIVQQMRDEFGAKSMVEVRQGVATLSQPMKDLAAELDANRIVYNNNPVDKYCLMNTYTKTDINGNIQPNKGASQTKRIDGTAALLDGYVVLTDNREEYESII